MSDEDRKWLEEAMKQYTFNDTDRLKQVIDILKKQSAAAQKRLLEEKEGEPKQESPVPNAEEEEKKGVAVEE